MNETRDVINGFVRVALTPPQKNMVRQKLEEERFTSTCAKEMIWLGVIVALSSMLDEAKKRNRLPCAPEFLQWLTDQRWLVGLTVRHHPLGGEASVVVLVALSCS